MDEFRVVAETVPAAVLRHTDDGTITYANQPTEAQTGHAPGTVTGTDVRELFPEEHRAAALEHLQGTADPDVPAVHTETAIRTEGATRPVELRASALADADEYVLVLRDVRSRKQREQYLQFARDINELIIHASDEPGLLQDIIDTVAERKFGCTSIGILDDQGHLDEIHGVMEDWCELNWDAVYTSEYIADVLAESPIVIDDVTVGEHRQHEVEKADHGAVALALTHRGNEYGVLTMHLPGKGHELSEQELTLLQELGDNVATGIHNIRTEAELRDSRKQLAVLDRVLRHNVRNELSVVIGNSEALAETVPSEHRHHAERIRERARTLMDMTDTERDIVDLILAEPELTKVDLAAIIDRCVEECRRDHPDAELSATVPDTATVAGIPEIERAIQELLDNAVVHNDRSPPRVTVTATRERRRVSVEIADNGPGIPDQEIEVLTWDEDIDALSHGSGLALWLVNWIVKLSGGEIRFHERDPRGSVVEVALPPVGPAATGEGFRDEPSGT